MIDKLLSFIGLNLRALRVAVTENREKINEIVEAINRIEKAKKAGK